MKKCFDSQKFEEHIKNNISKELLNNNNEISDLIYDEEFENLEELSKKIRKNIYEDDNKIYSSLVENLEILDEKEENFIKNNNIKKKEEKVKYYHYDEKPIKDLEYNDIINLKENSCLVKSNEKEFQIIGPNDIKIFDNNCKLIANLKIPIKNFLILKNGDILIKTEASNYMEYFDRKTFKRTKKYFIYSQNSIPLYSLNDGRIIFKNTFEGLYIYESKDNKYIITNFINQIPIGIHQLNDDSIIIFKLKCMLQYSTKNFKMMNILENKYDNYKALNFNDSICIIYGGEEYSACSESVIYFIDRKKFQILSCFNSNNIVQCIVSSNKILFAYLINKVTTNRHRVSHKLNIYKIIDAENVYLDSEDIYIEKQESIKDMININEYIIVNSGNRLVSIKI